jgi:hypothetical protein
MTWLVWRQHRYQVYFAAAALGAFAVLLLVTGLQMASQYHSALASCAANGSCGNLADTLHLGSPVLFALVSLTIAVPGLLGVFWGGPLVARELETGTSQFVWMQSVTRRHWLTVKTGSALLAAAAWGGAVTALVTWWSSPQNALELNTFEPGHFDVQGIVPIGYAVFAVALGITAGTLIRRTVPALAVTAGLFASLRIAITYFVRPHFMHPLTATFNPAHPTLPAGAAWQLTQGTINPAGQTLPGGARLYIPSGCRNLVGLGTDKLMSCMGEHGYRAFITFQPANRYWTFQGIETAIFLALASVLVATTAIVLLHRDA